MSEASILRKIFRTIVPKNIRNKIHIMILKNVEVGSIPNTPINGERYTIEDKNLIGLLQLLDRRIFTLESRIHELNIKIAQRNQD